RALTVTGVQTCALPISDPGHGPALLAPGSVTPATTNRPIPWRVRQLRPPGPRARLSVSRPASRPPAGEVARPMALRIEPHAELRSEERRVGKERESGTR